MKLFRQSEKIVSVLHVPSGAFQKGILIMKLTTIILLVFCMQVSANVYSQQVSLNTKNATLETVLKSIKQQTGYDYVADQTLLENANQVTLSLKNVSVQQALATIFKNQPLTYTLDDKVVTVKEKPSSLFDKLKSIITSIDIHGVVIGENNQPLSGATVAVKGTAIATTTDVHGRFSIANVDPDAVIVISFIGYDKQELRASSDMGAIKLVLATSKLDEVQVIAYGQTTQRLTTGNITAVSGKEISNQPVDNPLLALEGRVPGLQITQSNGYSGSAVKIRVQGINSIGNGNDPLYVIDGVPYPSQTLTTTGLPATVLANSGGGGGAGNPMAFVNPDDIESIEVLKDASATAIYGSRAANGAILITTKKGKPGDTQVNIDAQQGWGQVTHFVPELNTQQFLAMRHEAYKNDGATPTSTAYDINGQWDTTRYTNWQKVLIGNTAHYSDYNATISGGSANTQFLIGATYHDQTSVLPASLPDQNAGVHFSINNSSANQRFKVQLTGSYYFVDNKLPVTDLTSYALALAPDAPALRNADGSLNWAPTSSGVSTLPNNPLNYTVSSYESKSSNLVSNALLSYELIKGLTLKTSLGINKLNTDEFSGYPLTGVMPEVRATTTRLAYYSNSSINTWIAEPQLNYKNQFGKSHLDVLLGATIQQTNNEGQSLAATGFESDDVLKDIKQSTAISVTGTDISTYKYAALFGRLNYVFADKYIIDLTARRDGSSHFGPANQFHGFGSIGAAWIFTEESFIKNNLPLLSYGKLRGSYGTTGSDQIGNYQYLSRYDPVNAGVAYQGSNGLSPSNLSNPYLQWESTHKMQLGVDLGLIKDRVIISINYADNRSSNQLLGYNLPSITGFSGITENFPATVRNTDWEFSVNTINIKGSNFKWSTNFNLTIPRNTLIAFPNIGSSSYANSLIIGKSINILQVYKFAGVNSTTGLYQYYDHNGNPTSSPDYNSDRTELIDLQPKFYGGIENTFTYKGFSLDFLFQFTKQETATGFYGNPLPGYNKYNQPISVLQRWQKPGDQTPIQRYSQNFTDPRYAYSDLSSSDAYYKNLLFFRLRNVSLSWNLPKTWVNKIKFKDLAFVLRGQNLLTLGGKGLYIPDPETGPNTLPPLRILTAGIRATL